jgi:hypothetical protein
MEELQYSEVMRRLMLYNLDKFKTDPGYKPLLYLPQVAKTDTEKQDRLVILKVQPFEGTKKDEVDDVQKKYRVIQ